MGDIEIIGYEGIFPIYQDMTTGEVFVSCDPDDPENLSSEQ